MKYSFVVLLACLFFVAGCGAPKVNSKRDSTYRISRSNADAVSFRMLDAINALRKRKNARPLKFNAALNAAAATQARDMFAQNRPWHFGSDGSSPPSRAEKSGYQGRVLGEAISESFDTELVTLAAWLKDPSTRNIMLDPRAGDLGFSWYQESTGKLWWVLVTGQGDVFSNRRRVRSSQLPLPPPTSTNGFR